MILTLEEPQRSRWESLNENAFYRLVRHCADRVFYGGDGTSCDVEMGIGAVLAIFSTPGTFAAVALAVKYGTVFHFLRNEAHFNAYVASFPDEYFFAVLSMTIAGAVAVWKWDSLLPDRRDHANLAHLPILGGRILVANLLALVILVVIVAVDVNAGSAILFPLIACWTAPTIGYIVVFFFTHAVAMMLAAVFGFVAVLAILGILMASLPYRVFRKCSVYVRTTLLILFVALLMTSFSEGGKIETIHSAVAWTNFPPPVWFAALCQWLRGIDNALFPALSLAAVLGTVAVLVIATGAYALSYRRCFLRSAETMVILPAGGGAVAAHVLRALDGVLLRGPVQRGGFRFVIKTLFRSETHALTWIGFTAVGVMIASNDLLLAGSKTAASSHQPSAVVLGLPLILTYFLMFGLRVAFEIPGPLRANWTFRLGVDPGTRECAALARRVMIAFEVPLLAASLVLYAHFWGWEIAIVHTLLLAAMAGLLIETLLLGFRKIPFTCTAPPFKQTTSVAVILDVLGLFGFSAAVPALERHAFVDPLRSATGIALLLMMWWVCLYGTRKNQIEPERRLIFEDALPPVLEVLDLTFRK